MSPNLKSYRQDEFIDALKRFGITCRAGDGSEWVLEGYVLGSKEFRKYIISGSKPKRTLARPLMKKILRRFNISVEDFCDDRLH